MTGSSNDLKATTERQIFLDFAERMGEKDAWLRVESRNPPEPDLLCTLAQREQIAAITDPLIAQVNAGDASPGFYSLSTSDPSERIIRKKLSRKYETKHPLELLLYNDQLVVMPDDSITAKIVPWIGSLSHPFQQVWFMGQRDAKCIWSAG